MKCQLNAIGIFGLIFLLLISACKKDKTGILPSAEFKVTPSSGLTTDSFKFDASFTRSGNPDDKPYFRWDWNNDGIWDGEYSRIQVVQHRFYAPGVHKTRMEVINSSGLIDTTIVEIKVEQGYSYPRPVINISPPEGNFRTEFIFDASSSIDDEDSLESLLFRWDFQNTGFWDVGFNSSPVATHVYQDTGQYTIKLEVQDPTKRIASKTTGIQVTNINPELVADFSWSPVYGTTVDSFMFDASLSYHKSDPNPQLLYSWKMPPEYEWGEWTVDPIKYHRFGREVVYWIELRVKDRDSLINNRRKELQIYHKNLPPNPKFDIGTTKGNIKTQFYFDSWPTLDLESLPTTLQVRWDFNGDGSYDTDYSYEKIAYYQYPTEGRYKITMQAIDPEGLSDTISHYVDVSPWENETGLIKDHRDGQYYGTVKIGDQWWMAENLNFSPSDPNKDVVRKYCYQRYLNDPVRWCEIYGGLYNVYHATRNDWYGDVKGICPKDWHIPSKTEWEEMIDHIGGYYQSNKLLPGGETDFNALYAGFGSWKLHPEMNDYWWVYEWRGYGTYFWAFTKLSGSMDISSWNITLIKNQDKIYPGYSSNNMLFSVRCVKDE